MTQRHLSVFVLAYAVGCGGERLSSNASKDSGTAADSGMVTDTGADAGNTPDTGPLADTGAPIDSGSRIDGGGPSDGGGVSDAGEGDGGAAGACTNPADEAIHMNNDVAAVVEMCAGDCFGGRPCTRDCIMMNLGLSMECSACYLDAISCTIQNCLSECAGMNSAGCEQCRDDNGCTEGFRTCSGLG